MGPTRAPYYKEPFSTLLEFANWRTAELEGPQLDPLLPSPKPSLESALHTLERAAERVEGYLRLKKILGTLS
jgi:hypothetical protein